MERAAPERAEGVALTIEGLPDRGAGTDQDGIHSSAGDRELPASEKGRGVGMAPGLWGQAPGTPRQGAGGSVTAWFWRDEAFAMLKHRPMLHISCSSAAEAWIIDHRAGQAAMETGSMGTVLEDVTSKEVDEKHIRRRVEDWEERLNGLFAKIRGWLPDGWEARPGDPIVMHEPLMSKFGMDAKLMPTLELHDRAGHAARLEPRGLWIIGTNGRVDLKGGSQRYLIVDMAENFETPDWQAARAERRCEREAVTRGWLRRALQ